MVIMSKFMRADSVVYSHSCKVKNNYKKVLDSVFMDVIRVNQKQRRGGREQGMT
jgi:hypothetical protein